MILRPGRMSAVEAPFQVAQGAAVSAQSITRPGMAMKSLRWLFAHLSPSPLDLIALKQLPEPHQGQATLFLAQSLS